MGKRGNPQCLTPFKKGEERCKEIGSMGGKKSAAARKAHKDMRDSANRVLSLSLKKGDLIDIEGVNSIAESENINLAVGDAINIVMAQRALMGDVQAAVYIRDMAGQKPSDKVQVDQSLTIESWAKTHRTKL